MTPIKETQQDNNELWAEVTKSVNKHASKRIDFAEQIPPRHKIIKNDTKNVKRMLPESGGEAGGGPGGESGGESEALKLMAKKVQLLQQKMSSSASSPPSPPSPSSSTPLPPSSLSSPVPSGPADLSEKTVHGIDKRTAQKLKKGAFGIDETLDLHGYTQKQAHEKLHKFIMAAVRGQKRHLLIITGKGVEGSGVLKQNVPLWMKTPPMSLHILAISPAQPQDGGQGALYVKLKKRVKLSPTKLDDTNDHN